MGLPDESHKTREIDIILRLRLRSAMATPMMSAQKYENSIIFSADIIIYGFFIH